MAIQTDLVQNALVKFATNKISKALKTEVRIDRISISFFSKISMDGTLIRDQKKDTILYAGSLKVNITDWFFLKDKAELKYIGLENAVVKLQRKDSTWNYQFIADYFSTPSNPKKKKKTFELNLKKVDLKNVHFFQNDLWIGSQNTVKVGALIIDADKIDFINNQYLINEVILTKPAVTLQNLDGLRPAKLKRITPYYNGKEMYFNEAGIGVKVKKIKIKDGSLFIEGNTNQAKKGFDESHIELFKLNGVLSFEMRKDTMLSKANLSVKDRSGFELKRLAADIRFTPQIMEFRNLDLQTNKSKLGNYYAMLYKDFNKDFADYINKVKMVAQFSNSKIHSDDIAYFASELKGLNKQLQLGGNFIGTVSDFKVSALNASIGASTQLNGNLAMKGLPYINTTQIDFSNGTLSTNAYDLGVFIPAMKGVVNPDLAALGNIIYRGGFKGTIQNFNTSGVFSTKLGGVQTNISLALPNKGEPSFDGFMSTKRFDLGKFLKVDSLGLINFSGKLTGSSFNIDRLKTKFDGVVHSVEYNHYLYTNIIANGTIQRKSFNGELEIDDPNLGFTSNVEIDFSKEEPLFNIVGDLSKADLHALKLIKDEIKIAGLLDVNFTGSNVDQFIGSAKFLNANIQNPKTSIQFDSLNISSSYRDSIKTIHVGSNDFNATIEGKFNIKELPSSFQAFLHNYYPAYVKSPLTTPKNQQFNFSINSFYIEPYFKIFTHRISGFNDVNFKGSIDTRNIALSVSAYIPYGKYDQYAATGFQLDGKGDFDSLDITTNIKNFEISDSLNLPNSVINITSANDHSIVSINTSANSTLDDAALLADVYTLEDGVRVQFKPSSFVLNDKRWSIEEKGELIVRKNLLRANNLKFSQGGFQEIAVETEEEDGGNTSNLIVKLKNIVLGDITSLFMKKETLEGVVSGEVKLSDFFGDFVAKANLKATEFSYEQDSIGVVEIDAGYDSKTGLIPFKVNSPNINYNLSAKGSYNTKDTTGNSFNTDIQLNETKIDIIESLLTGLFSNLSGIAKGNLQISGDLNAPQLIGDISLRNAGLKVEFTQVEYKIDSAELKFREDGIDFGRFNIKDIYGNTGSVNGKLIERGFKNMAFDFDLRTDKLLMIDTKAKDNEQFYGRAIGKASLSFKGPESDCKMTIVAEANDSSHITIPNKQSKESGAADFIVFKTYGTELESSRKKSNFNLTVDLDVTANNKVVIDVILDEINGDIIKAVGNGRLIIKAGTVEPLSIKGRYNIERGNYDFNFQSLLKKPFQLLPNSNNYIEWNGDPLKAFMSIDAQYTAERISLSDLIGNNIFSGSVKGYRGDVYVIAELRNQLSKPDISFRLDFPQGSPVKNDNEFAAFLNRIQRDENEILKQVSFLIVFGTFAPPGEFSNGSGSNPYNISSLGINTLSQVLTNEVNKALSGLLYKLTGDRSLRFDLGASLYNSSSIFGTSAGGVQSNNSVLDRSRVNFKLGKSFLNNNVIVTFGGDLDFNLGASSSVQNGNFQWLPDLTIEIILTKDRKLRAIVFNKNSLDISGSNFGRRNRTGASISYRRDFEKLWGKKEKEIILQSPVQKN